MNFEEWQYVQRVEALWNKCMNSTFDTATYTALAPVPGTDSHEKE